MRLYEAKNLGKVSDKVDDVKSRLENLSRRVDRQLEDVENNQDSFSNHLQVIGEKVEKLIDAKIN